MRDSFLRRTKGQALILPRMQAVGDIGSDEDAGGPEFLLSGSFADKLPPEISSMERQILLARLITARDDFKNRPYQAIALAEELGRFLDQIYIEGLPFDTMADLVPEELSDHWQITLEFLKIIVENWPIILEERGVMDAANRRSKVLGMLADEWASNPPSCRIIAAGSTGSVPATSNLLSVIASMKNGEVILPGLDPETDDESWEAIDETHPQFMLKQFLGKCEVRRKAVPVWPGATSLDLEKMEERRKFTREIMRPAETTHMWKETAFKAETDNILRYECNNPHEEAGIIALHLREALERREDFTASLVTPDRALARRVVMACRRWGIEIDDSGGTSLRETKAGSFLGILASCIYESSMSPSALLSLLKHPLAGSGIENTDITGFRHAIRDLDKNALRGKKPAPGFDQIKERLESKQTLAVIERLEEILQEMSSPKGRGDISFSAFLEAHIRAAEKICLPDILWRGDDGEAAALFVANLRRFSDEFADISASEYSEIFEQLMKGVTVRPEYGMHPRVFIFGQLEARLIDTDLVILGGLNEGSWPPEARIDPWMSRPMKKEFGLPLPERRTGQSAHDFVESFCSGEIILTRSIKSEGAPCVPSRWLQRMDAVLESCGVKPEILEGPFGRYIHALNEAPLQKSCERPCPAPPPETRPRKLSVTEIEKLRSDPYSIYAKHVLRLKKLEAIEKEFGADDKGNLIHGILEKFVNKYPCDLPEDAFEELFILAQKEMDNSGFDQAALSMLRPRIKRICRWFVENEREWRTKAKNIQTEAKGNMRFNLPGGEFLLTGRADRIDLLSNGDGAIIDYKSGGTYSPAKMRSMELPQLPLEAWMIANGGFENIPEMRPGMLCYMVLTGGKPEGKNTILNGEEVEEIAEKTGEGLCEFLSVFEQEDTAYCAVPNPDKAPRYNDYEHLERIKEWAVPEDGGEDEYE